MLPRELSVGYHRPVLDPTARPRPRLLPMLRLLADHDVRWVLTGSAVLAIYGADIVPNDLDVTPSLALDNLSRLARALTEASAIPAFVPEWRADQTVEWCRRWRPEPATEQHLDHLFVTRLGMLDVPPRLCGSYDELLPLAATVEVGGVPVRVCHPREVLDRLDGRDRAKDRERAHLYAAMRGRGAEALAPTGVDRLLAALP